MTLRARLFASHTIVAIISLIVLSTAALILLGDVQRNLRLQALSNLAPNIVRVARNLPGPIDNREILMERLSRATKDRNARVLLLDPKGVVLQDSVLARDAGVIGLKLDLTNVPALITVPTEVEAAGEFRDPQRRRWIFVAMPTDAFGSAAGPQLPASYWIAIATQLRSGPILNVLESELALPILQGTLISMLLAGVIAAIVARGIARPILHVSAAAAAIARGEYSQRVPLKGPLEMQVLATDFNVMADRVLLAQRMERDLLANVSHELKTPLTSIRGFAQAITDGATTDSPMVQHAAAIILEEADRLGRLVNGLLDSARLETGDVRMTMSTVDLGAVLQDCIRNFDPSAIEAGVAISFARPPNLTLNADGDRLAQMFTNLLDNALKHTPRGGAVQISASAEAGPTGSPGIAAVVQDNGYGIPAADLPRIFDRFYQVDKSRTVDGSGTGLGLAICKQIVQAHHGAISVNSETGQGTVFRVWLPSGLFPK